VAFEMMSRMSRMTHVTPLPPTISREAAVEYLHDHAQMIELNPLVLRHEKTTPHAGADADEAENMVWHEITDEIQYIPGTPLKGEICYKAGFYDLSNGLQTHTFAAGGVDLRGKWTVGGSLPGEKRESVEIGSNKPREGLYIQEDVQLRCNILLTGFVKKNLKKSHATLVGGMISTLEKSESAKAAQATKQDSTGASSDAVSHANIQASRPALRADSGSAPSSYTQAPSCTCPMGSFDVHLESCALHPEFAPPAPLASNSERTSAPGQTSDAVIELDGHPVAAQDGRIAELE